jgi:tRNA pseudouridine38-40 synthase
MALYKSILEYDGTAFYGMQRQKDVRTVQGDVENSLARIGWQGKSISFAGRTDAGVHAVGQVISFSLNWNHTCKDLQNALNATLPLDTAVSNVTEASSDFHPRFSAKNRTYRYSIYCHEHRKVIQEKYTWRVWPYLNIDAMNEAASSLIGRHDFGSFGTAPKKGNPTVREITSALWEQQNNQFSFEISANAFLYHMVRRVVFLLVEVGHGRQTIANVENFIKDPQRRMVPGLAPSKGLSLIAVNY